MLGIKYQIKPESLRQTDSPLLPPAPPPPFFSSQGPRDSHSTLDMLFRGLTGCGQGLIDSLLMLPFPPHTWSSLFYTHTHAPCSPPLPPPALVWVSVIAPGLVRRRLHSTIHTNHSASALWMGPFWLCPCKVRPPLKRTGSVSLSFLYAHRGRCMMKPAHRDK